MSRSQKPVSMADAKVGRDIYFSSGALLAMAKQFADLSKQHSNQALSAIVFGAASVEGWFHDAALLCRSLRIGKDDPPECVTRFSMIALLEPFERASLKERIELMCASLGASPPKLGEGPLQQLSVLVDLRNYIIHIRPEYGGPLGDPTTKLQRTLKHLMERGLISSAAERASSSGLGWLARPAIGEWAFDTAQRSRLHLLDLLPDGVYKQPIAVMTGVETRKPAGDGASS